MLSTGKKYLKTADARFCSVTELHGRNYGVRQNTANQLANDAISQRSVVFDIPLKYICCIQSKRFSKRVQLAYLGVAAQLS